MTLGRSPKALKHTLRNLVSSLIQHEHIITTPAKAKLTASYLENLITKTKHNSGNKWNHLLYGKLYNQDITIPKLNEFVDRYSNRSNGYTRTIHIESRFGDNAPQVILEMVDNECKEMMFWYVAKIIARLELQNLKPDPLTLKNMDKVIKYKENGEAKFREVVEICKEHFFTDDSAYESLEANKPRFKNFDNGFNKQTKNFKIVPRE